MDELKELRKEIDRIDEELILILSERLRIVDKVKHYKEIHGVKVEDKDRERLMKKNRLKWCSEYGVDPKFALKVFDDIITESKRVQKG